MEAPLEVTTRYREPALPRWSLQGLYPGLDSLEFAVSYDAFVDEVQALIEAFDHHAIGPRPPTALNAETVQIFETILTGYDAVLTAQRSLDAYLECVLSSEADNERARAIASALNQQMVPLATLEARWLAWIASLDLEALIAGSTLAREHALLLRKAHVAATHLLTPPEEELVAELSLTGSAAWTNLYESLTAQLVVPIARADGWEDLPMSAALSLAFDPDRDLRRKSHAARDSVWHTHRHTLAAALNAIKGEHELLARRRGWESSLDVTLFENHIDRATLEAMHAAVDDAMSGFRRYFVAKARAVGVPVLAGYDLCATLEGNFTSWTFAEARDFILAQFGTYSSELRTFAERAFREGWIDAEPRPGKQGGACCINVGRGESRVLVNFASDLMSMGTLAHELGHAYHHFRIASQTTLQQEIPLSLAETASIFCEMLVLRAVRDQAAPQDCLALLDAMLRSAYLQVVDVTLLFRFEQQLVAQRMERELSAEELTDLALAIQREAYGGSVDAETLSPYFWAEVPQLYTAAFYSFPYTFGYLLGVGLYAHFQRDPRSFVACHEHLLTMTGRNTVAELLAPFGIDVRSSAFWQTSLRTIDCWIDEYVALIAERREAHRDRR